MPFVVGETIGPYRILEQLGRGGMATVFKAYHASLDRYVAIKALHPAFMEDPNFLARFQREAQVVAKLEHPNIVPIYDFAEYESRPYLVMKYIEGETLKARITESAIPQDALLQIVEAVGAGLAYAHQKGILHRDVKPSNVLLGYDGRVYLADFGLARIAQAGESTLSSDMMLGTPQYISPEQAMGLGELDERTDIYSFGVMLYEMTVGKVPFSADTPFSIIHDHIYTPLPLPRSVNPDVTESVERVLLKALAKERDDRYPDANALAAAFKQAILADEDAAPVVVPPTPEQTLVPEPAPVPETAKPAAVVTAAAAAKDTGVADIGAADIGAATPPVVGIETPVLEMDAVQPHLSSPTPEKKKRRFRWRWWFIPLALILIVICCYGSLLALGAIQDLSDNGRIDPPPPGEQLPPPEPFQEPPPREPLEAPSLDDAQSQLDDDPEDPYHWFDLAKAHWQVDQQNDAREALNKALDMAGDNADFYFEVAESLASSEIWVDAARVYLEGISRFYPDGVPEDFQSGFHEAAFWAAEYPEAERDIPIHGIANVDLPLERVVMARYQFHYGDEYEAQNILDEILTRLKPGMPEAMFLQAEILYDWGDASSAFGILNDLLERDDTPDWLREYIDYMLSNAMNARDEALAGVDENPDDPWAYLVLFEADLALSMYAEAEQDVQRALRLDGGDPAISQYAGDIAATYGAWLQAAQLYAHSAQLTPDETKPELADKFLQALYYAAAEEGAPEILDKMEISLPDAARENRRGLYKDVLIARYKLYYENVGEAQEILEGVLAQAPDFPLAQLVRAEIYLMVGDYEAAREILERLDQNKDLPPWFHDEVRYMLNEIQS